jgi:hypothetical protein
MSFKLVYHSQQDPQWKNDILGLGDPTDTLGEFGCAITSIAMLLSGHGYPETPKTLNEKMKNSGGFQGSYIVWGAISNIHPQVTLKEHIPCETTDAPLAKIDAALAAGQPVVVRVDSSPAPGLQWHYVLLYARKGNDYLMLDPYPYQPGTVKEDLLMARYSRGNPLQRSIQQILIYNCSTSGGAIATPASPGTTSTPQPQPTPASSPAGGIQARVTDEVTAFLRIRTSTDTSSDANVVATVTAGTILTIVNTADVSKLGINGQWVRVRTAQGQEGMTAAWFLEKVAGATPAPSTGATPSPVSEAPASTPTAPSAPTSTPAPSAPSSTPSPTPQLDPTKKYLMVSDVAGTSGTSLRKTASNSGEVLMTLTPGMLLIVIEPYAKAKAKLGQQNQWIYVRGPNKKPGYVLSQFVKLP